MPKNDQIWPKIGIFGQFGPGHAGLFNALLVGRLVVVARGLYLARHLFTLFYYAVPSSKYIFFEVGPDTIAKMELYRSIFYKVTFTVQWELVVKTVSTLTALLSRSLEIVVRHKIMFHKMFSNCHLGETK